MCRARHLSRGPRLEMDWPLSRLAFIGELDQRGDSADACVQCPPSVQGTTIRDGLAPQPSGMSRFSAAMFSKSSALNLVNPHFLEMWIFWRPENLNLARRRASITCSLFCSLVRMDIKDLANVDPGHCALGLSKGTSHTCLESISPSARQHLVDVDDVKGVEPHLDVKTISATAFHHVLVGTNMGSLQGFREELIILI